MFAQQSVKPLHVALAYNRKLIQLAPFNFKINIRVLEEVLESAERLITRMCVRFQSLSWTRVGRHPLEFLCEDGLLVEESLFAGDHLRREGSLFVEMLDLVQFLYG